MQRKCVMLECSNLESKGQIELNNIGKLEIDSIFYFRNIKSSPILKIEFIEDLIKITTKNTKYLFRKIEEN